jgi:hypothetical protein
MENLAQARVQYLHRTVRNFVASDRVHKKLITANRDSTFNPHKRLAYAYLAQLNLLEIENPMRYSNLLGLLYEGNSAAYWN